MSFSEITVAELAAKLEDTSENVQCVDVREPQELAIARIDRFINLPLSEYADWSPAIDSYLDREVETLVLCHHGMRSAQMCQWLVSQGFSKVYNIKGGIDEYARAIDPKVPKY
jgi:rhodanese-related sulfurtransferase